MKNLILHALQLSELRDSLRRGKTKKHSIHSLIVISRVQEEDFVSHPFLLATPTKVVGLVSFNHKYCS